jgi:hypothetical protein
MAAMDCRARAAIEDRRGNAANQVNRVRRAHRADAASTGNPALMVATARTALRARWGCRARTAYRVRPARPARRGHPAPTAETVKMGRQAYPVLAALTARQDHRAATALRERTAEMEKMRRVRAGIRSPCSTATTDRASPKSSPRRSAHDMATTRANAADEYRARNDRQAEWLREAIAAQERHYERDDRRPRFRMPRRCPACGLSPLGTERGQL